MRNKKSSYRFVFMLVLMLALVAFPASVSANHSWGNYHWARTSNPSTVKVINSMTTDWDDNLNIAVSDWNSSSVMNVVQEAGNDDAQTRSRCRPVKQVLIAPSDEGPIGLERSPATDGIRKARQQHRYLA